MDRYSGTLAVVTGSYSGMGAAITKELLKRGLTVVGLARSENELQRFKNELDKSCSSQYHTMKCDVTNERDVAKAFEAIKTIGKLSILVNCAGVFGRTPVHEMHSEDINKIFNTNVKGVIFCSQHAVKSMKENCVAGHIVNICSALGIYTMIEKPRLGVYTASKHAVKMISDELRREQIATKTKIKVSNISPGLVDTEMTNSHLPEDPNKYIGPEDVAKACMAILDTPAKVVIAELTIMATIQML